MTQAVNTSNTKKEIYEAYTSLIEKYEKLSKQRLLWDEKPLIQPKRTVGADVFESIESVKLHVGKSMDKLANSLRNKMDSLEQIEKEIKENKIYLEKVLEIKAQWESLYALVDMQTAKENEFEQMIATKKQEQENMESKWRFEFDQKKQKEKHEREIKKAEIQREFDDDIRIEKEKLFVSKKELQTQAKLKKEFTTEKILMKKDFENEKNIHLLQIENLETKLAEIDKENKSLRHSVEVITSKMEQLAEKVVDGGRPIVYGEEKK